VREKGLRHDILQSRRTEVAGKMATDEVFIDRLGLMAKNGNHSIAPTFTNASDAHHFAAPLLAAARR
jgi:hypothetical protein